MAVLGSAFIVAQCPWIRRAMSLSRLSLCCITTQYSSRLSMGQAELLQQCQSDKQVPYEAPSWGKKTLISQQDFLLPIATSEARHG